MHRRLLRQTVLVLAATHASEAARDASLGALESILDLGPSYADVILRRHTAELLESLRSLVAAAAAANGGARPKRLRPGVKVCRHRWTYVCVKDTCAHLCMHGVKVGLPWSLL